MKMDEPLAICYKRANLIPFLLFWKLLAASLKMGASIKPLLFVLPILWLVHALENANRR